MPLDKFERGKLSVHADRYIDELESALDDLISLADEAMLMANRDGGEFDRDEELREYRKLIEPK